MMKKKKLLLNIILLFIISILFSDIDFGYSFLGMAKQSDLIAMVKIFNSFEHGYECIIKDVIFSNHNEKIGDMIVFWCENSFEFGRARLIAKRRDEFIIALDYIDKDTKYENEYAIFIEKKGTYFLSDAGESYLPYKNGKVKGRLFKPFGWILNNKKKYKFIPYKTSEIEYQKYKEILKKELGKKK